VNKAATMARTDQLLEDAALAFQRTTGLTAHAGFRKFANDRYAEPLLQIEAAKTKYRFHAEIKAVDRFLTPALVKTQRGRNRHPAILVAPYITRETAEHCRKLKLPFIDTAGNAYIEAERLLIYVVGQPRPSDLVRNKFRALTPAGLQLTFALLCRPDLLQKNYREIAKAGKVALGTVGPIIKDLKDRGLLRIAPDGNLHDKQRLVAEWVMHYPVTLRPKLEARRFEADPRILTNANLKGQHAYWGGEPAADRLTHVLRPKAFTIYTAGDWRPLAAAYRMRAHPRGNVEVVKAFWNFTLDGLDPEIAPPLLVYADLMATDDGRNVEVADLIYERHIRPKLNAAG
jgi:hypothetical protein